MCARILREGLHEGSSHEPTSRYDRYHANLHQCTSQKYLTYFPYLFDKKSDQFFYLFPLYLFDKESDSSSLEKSAFATIEFYRGQVVLGKTVCNE